MAGEFTPREVELLLLQLGTDLAVALAHLERHEYLLGLRRCWRKRRRAFNQGPAERDAAGAPLVAGEVVDHVAARGGEQDRVGRIGELLPGFVLKGRQVARTRLRLRQNGAPGVRTDEDARVQHAQS